MELTARQAYELLNIEPHTLSAIYATGTNGAFSLNGALPWKNAADMAFFKAMTINSIVIMGRKTYESLPPKHRPLSQRVNIVVSKTMQSDGLDLSYIQEDSLEAALETASKLRLPIFVIGGVSLIEQVLPIATNVIVTIIPYEGTFDSTAPEISDDSHERVATIQGYHDKWEGMKIQLYKVKGL